METHVATVVHVSPREKVSSASVLSDTAACTAKVLASSSYFIMAVLFILFLLDCRTLSCPSARNILVLLQVYIVQAIHNI